MLEQGRDSHVVNTASGAGLAPNPKMAPYVTSKFAAVGMSLSLDAELSEQGIRVMALCPGLVNTNIISDTLLSGEMAARREQTKKMYEKRGATPESVADAMLEGLRKNKVIVITPWQHVKPSWWILRISPRLFQVFSRRVLAKAFD
jgi:short-subunit dehydrogenase